MNVKDFTADELYETIIKMLNNPSYAEKTKKCSRIIHSMPSPQETLIFWVNHILEFGGEHLRPASVDMPFYQMFMFDVIAFLATIVFVVLLAFCCCFRFLCRKLTKYGKQKKE